MKDIRHANTSAAKWGGKPEDYIHIHEFIDSTKAHIADVRHRALLHNSWGVFIVEKVFGKTLVNSSGKTVSIRDIAEEHIKEDLGWIPSPNDYWKHMPVEKWMGGNERTSRRIYKVVGKEVSVSNT
jgi:hypothetical protein